MKRSTLWPCLALVLLGIGCVSPGRLADLRDCFELSVGVGPGLAVDVDLGYLSHPSIGFAAVTQRAGVGNRECCGRWKETEWPFPTTVYIVFHPEGGGSPLASYASNRDPAPRGGRKNHELDFWLPPVVKTKGIRRMHKLVPFWTFHNATDFGAGATLAVVSVRAGLNPLETIDFALGFVGLDIGRDSPRAGKADDAEAE